LEAENGRVGLELFRREHPDIVVVDLRMPEMDGLDVLSSVRKISPDTPVIMMSGTGVMRDVVEALRKGAWNYILKPIEDLSVLQHALENALEQARLIRESRLYQEHLEEEVNRRTRELEEAAQELRKSEEKYRSIFENLQDAYFETSLNGILLEISPSIEFFSHYNREEILNTSIVNLYSNPGDRGKIIEILEKAGKIVDFELNFMDKEGSIVYCSINANFQFDGIGAPIKICGTIRNISERKRAEVEKQKLLEQLHQSQKIEALGSLTGGIAHDFNNILTVINGHAEIALRKLEKNLPVEKDIHSIFQAGKRAENLTRQLLAFSRKQVFKPRVIDMNKIINDLEKMLVRLIGEDIRMEIRFNSDAPSIDADPGQIEQILMNLIVNARDAIIENRNSTEEKKIIIETGKTILDKFFVEEHPGSGEGLHTVLTISDSGAGMTPDVLEKIFEPFFTTKEKEKGTGLGLSTVYGIVKQNSGSIYVYSEPGQGSIFKIYWPSAKESAPPEPEVEKKVSIENLRGNESILLVEDDDPVRNFAVNTLREFGYNVIEASNGKKALNMVKKRMLTVNLLLTDLIMPEMNGKELAEKIKELIPEAAVLYASGYTDEHIIHRYKLEEGIHFIQKPYSSHDLAAKVRDALDKRKDS
jgi:two-component system, cell cycle sensor histidine kinase and response regulator CckA